MNVVREERGGAPAVEAAVLALVIGAVITFTVAAGRVAAAEAATDHAARAAARTVSLARVPRAAEPAAIERVRQVLAEQDLACDALTVQVDAGDEVVTVTVTCAVRWSDLALPGNPQVTSRFASPVDQFRERP